MTTPVKTAVGLALLAAIPAGASAFDSEGAKIHYTVAGKGEPVVFIHGFMGSSEEWLSPPPYLPPEAQAKVQPIARALSTNFTTITLDCRGHGQSDKPKGANAYGVEMVNDIVRLLDHLKLHKAHVVGYSMGTFIAAKLVELHPERVTSVVLGGGGALLDGSDQLAFMESVGKAIEAGKGVEPIILGMMPPDQPMPTAEQLAESNKMFLAGQDEAALGQVAFGHKQLTVAKTALPANDVPTLLVVGENDFLRASSEETSALMSKSKLVVLAGHDHVSTEMSPEFLQAIQNFLKENK